jgi:hypothetical protein
VEKKENRMEMGVCASMLDLLERYTSRDRVGMDADVLDVDVPDMLDVEDTVEWVDLVDLVN